MKNPQITKLIEQYRTQRDELNVERSDLSDKINKESKEPLKQYYQREQERVLGKIAMLEDVMIDLTDLNR